MLNDIVGDIKETNYNTSVNFNNSYLDSWMQHLAQKLKVWYNYDTQKK